MKLTYFFALATLFSTVIACQSDQEQNLTQPSGQAISSVYVEGKGAPSTNIPATGGARVAAASTTQQQQMLTAINQARSQSCVCGVTKFAATTALTLDTQLNTAADKHAVYLTTTSSGTLTHTGADSSTLTPGARMTKEGYKWQSGNSGFYGENIAGGFATPAAVVAAWLRSAGHCSVLMSPNFKDMGVGYALRPAGSSILYANYWVVDFGKRQ